MKRILILSIVVSCFALSTIAQEKQYNINTIAFYNLENLFDTIDSQNPDTWDIEFTPQGNKKYNTKVYESKLKNLSSVIEEIGSDLTNQPPAICGVSEIENASVLEDLIHKTVLNKYDYDYVHLDGPDERGVDVGLLYRKSIFQVTNVEGYELTFDFDLKDKTRYHLLISGLFNGEKMHIIVNHWPSRYGGKKASDLKRIAAGDRTRHIVDSLLALDPNSKIVVMGDLNDDPINKSITKHLRAKRKISDLKEGDMFNPMAQLFRDGVGSGAYRDKWNLFDQVIISQGLALGEKDTYKFYSAHVNNKTALTNREGRYKGYPWRTYVGNTFQGGYSDHFASYIYIIKEVD
jgi:uncharacterized protein (DUF2249 family)